jgi:Zn-dependent protease
MFGFNFDRKFIYILLGALVVMSLINTSGMEILSLLLTLPAVIIAITFHEFAHANAAVKLGDTTPKNQGRLTLNPLSHIDPFGFFLLMFANIGWGRPVQVNPSNYTSNKSRGFCDSMVALAGPLMNFFIAIIACIAYCLINYFGGGVAFFNTQIGAILILFLQILIAINIGLGVFNLIPLPPLDGEKIFRNLLPSKAQRWLQDNYATLSAVFMILWIFGFLEIIVSPVISALSQVLFFVVKNVILFFI